MKRESDTVRIAAVERKSNYRTRSKKLHEYRATTTLVWSQLGTWSAMATAGMKGGGRKLISEDTNGEFRRRLPLGTEKGRKRERERESQFLQSRENF